MSAWRIGRQTMAIDRAGSSGGPLAHLIDVVVKWIPGEVISFYATAIVVLAGDDPSARPSRVLWIVTAPATAAIVVLGSRTAGKSWRSTSILALLALVAFLIWSAAMPMSGWMTLGSLQSSASAVAVGAALAGMVFSRFAEWCVTRFDLE